MIIRSQNSTGVTCKGIRTVSLTGPLHSYIHNSQNMAATQEVISRWMDQKNVVYRHNGLWASLWKPEILLFAMTGLNKACSIP